MKDLNIISAQPTNLQCSIFNSEAPLRAGDGGGFHIEGIQEEYREIIKNVLRFYRVQEKHKNVKFKVSGQAENFSWAGNKNWLTKEKVRAV